MRALLIVTLLAGCTDSALDEDRAYRRLVDRFDTYDQCIADKSLASCYQTLVLCENRRAMIDLDDRPLDGTYELDGNIATAKVEGEMIVFDIEHLTSPQLPGRHAWELAMPSFTGCDVEP
jgi:hypothetical protein